MILTDQEDLALRGLPATGAPVERNDSLAAKPTGPAGFRTPCPDAAAATLAEIRDAIARAGTLDDLIAIEIGYGAAAAALPGHMRAGLQRTLAVQEATLRAGAVAASEFPP